MSALQIGMLWQREKPSLADDIAAAAVCYRAKYDIQINAVHVHPSEATEGVTDSLINIVPDPLIRPGTLWIGWAGLRLNPEAWAEWEKEQRE